MEKRNFHILGVLLMLIAVSEAGVIIPTEDPSGDGELPLTINKFDKKLNLPSGIRAPEQGRDEFGIYEYDMGASDPQESPDYDYGKPGNGDIVNEVDRHKPGIIKPGKISPKDENPIKNHGDRDHKKSGDETFDGEEDFDKSIGGSKDSKFPVDEDEDKPSHKDVDEARRGGDDEKKEPEEDEDDEEDDKKDPEDEEVVDDDDDDKKVPEDEKKEDDEDEKAPEDEGGDDEDKKVPEDEDDKVPEEKHVPIDDEEKPDENEEPKEEDEDHIPIDNDEKPIEDDEQIGGGEETEFFNRGSIFDTPIFNLDQVQKYFNQLERALGHVFRQTMDEAALLNGTYANTTEEEVEINGKKYIVQKSVIKGADNDSSIYIEALSSKSKTNDTQEVKDINVQNTTHV